MIRSDGAGSKDELRTPFVERRTYRRRRLMDVARVVPVLAGLLFALPLLWPDGQPGAAGNTVAAGAGPAPVRMSQALIYIFSVWAGLIVFAFGFSMAVRRWAVHWTGQHRGPEAGAEGRAEGTEAHPDYPMPPFDPLLAERPAVDPRLVDGSLPPAAAYDRAADAGRDPQAEDALGPGSDHDAPKRPDERDHP